MKPSYDEVLWNIEELLATSLSSNSSSIPCLCVNSNLFLPSLHLSLLICKMRRIILSISGSFLRIAFIQIPQRQQGVSTLHPQAVAILFASAK